jgi:hypothetical protein
MIAELRFEWRSIPIEAFATCLIVSRESANKSKNEMNKRLWQIQMRQQQERDVLIFEQLEKRRILQSRIQRLEALKSYRLDELEHDKSQYQAMREQRLEQLETQRQEQNRDRPPLRQRGHDWTR